MKRIKNYENIVFFDTETTGLDARECQIIELAAVSVCGGAQEEMDDFIRLPEGETIPEKIVELTHITDDMLLKDGIAEEAAAEKFYRLISKGRTLLVAHNCQFDLNFVGHMFMKFMAAHPEWLKAFSKADYLDSLTVFRDRRFFPHKLENAIKAYHLEGSVQNSHRAVDDCRALMEVTRSMQEERNDLATYVNYFGYNPKYGISGSVLKKVRYIAQPYRRKETGQRMVTYDDILPYHYKK